MFKKELVSMVSFYAIAPIHAGSGSSTGAVDNPIQRERHTNWPLIQASAVKGAMRSHFRRFYMELLGKEEIEKGGGKQLINYIFGSDEQDDWDKNKDSIPGAISVSDAKLLAMPVRSNIAPFVWVVSPAVLKRLKNDLEFVGTYDLGEIPTVGSEKAVVIGEWDYIGRVILEDAVIDVGEKSNFDKLEKFFNDNFPDVNKLLLISDEMFKYVVDNCTEIQTQIKIDEEKGTAKEGALRYEELLPSDTILYSVVYFSKTADKKLEPKAVMDNVKVVVKDFLQVGGDETLGRGICKVNWIEDKK